jgi:hypothetical protein
MPITTISGIYTEEIEISSHSADGNDGDIIKWSRINLGDVVLLVFSHDGRWPHVNISPSYGENPGGEEYSVAEELEGGPDTLAGPP